MLSEVGQPPRITAHGMLPRLYEFLACCALAAVACAGLGCSEIVDANRTQCSVDADCVARGARFAHSTCVASLCQDDPKWACLANPPAKSTAAGPFRVGMHLADLVNRSPLQGLTADLCRKVDVSCGDPASSTLSDDMGAVTLSVEAGFTGYVSLHSDTIVPTLYFFNPPVDHDQDIPALSLSNTAARAALLGQLQASTDRGDILLDAFDCTGKPASQIKFSLAPNDASAIPYYLASGLPSRSGAATDATGYGGFVNLPPGTFTVTATDTENQSVVNALTLVVRGGAATWARLVPNGN